VLAAEEQVLDASLLIQPSIDVGTISPDTASQFVQTVVLRRETILSGTAGQEIVAPTTNEDVITIVAVERVVS